MIINAYAVIMLLINGIRLPAAMLVIVLAMLTLARCRVMLSPQDRKGVEDRSYLLTTLVALLLMLNVVSWPVLYLLLQSYVPEFPGVMCIYGVTRVGMGSIGPSQYLPSLVTTLQLTKPALLFVGGGWFVIYWINRQTRTAVLLRRVLVGVLLLGVCSLADSVAESAYLLIPKRVEMPNAGCCTAITHDLAGSNGAVGWLPSGDNGWLSMAYFCGNGLMIAILAARFTFLRNHSSKFSLAILPIGTLVLVPISLLFLTEVAAPAILHLPLHHCAYDLIPAAPETVAGMGLFVVAVFSIGWACLAAWMARGAETEEFLPGMVNRALFLALFGFTGSLILFSVELGLNTTT